MEEYMKKTKEFYLEKGLKDAKCMAQGTIHIMGVPAEKLERQPAECQQVAEAISHILSMKCEQLPKDRLRPGVSAAIYCKNQEDIENGGTEGLLAFDSWGRIKGLETRTHHDSFPADMQMYSEVNHF